MPDQIDEAALDEGPINSENVNDAYDETLDSGESRMTFTLMDAEALAPLFFAVLFASTIFGLVYVLRGFLADLVMAFILIGLFAKPYLWCKTHIASNPWVASGLTTGAVFHVIVAPVAGLVYTIAMEATSAYGEASDSLARDGIVMRAHAYASSAGLPISQQTLQENVAKIATSLQELALTFGGAVVGDFFGIMMHLAVILVMVFYMQVDGERLRIFLYRLSPLPDDEDEMIVETFKKVSKGVIVGNGLGSIIQGFLGGLAMWWVGLPSPVLWGSIMALFAFLPLVGIAVVAVPAGVVLFFQGHTASAIGFLSFCFVQAMLVENIVKTKLMGSAMRMHDLLVFLSILGGIAAFGIIGMVYGPLIAMLFMTLNDLYESHYRPHLARAFSTRSP